MRISVIIPTYKRTQLLREALNSILNQTLPPHEIIIGDDTPDNSTNMALIAELAATTTIPLRYHHHCPALKQGGNVEFLINAAQGDALSLLHDDDLLEPTALADLAEPFAAHPTLTASYGKVTLIRADGSPYSPQDTEEINRDYYHTAAFAGLQKSTVEMAIAQQFTNNSYLVRTDAARAVGYNHFDTWGQSIDQAFGVHLSLLPGAQFFYIDKFIYRYRINSVSESTVAGHCGRYRSYKTILEDSRISKELTLVHQWLLTKAPIAIGEAIGLGKLDDAWAWYWGPYHRERILTLGGINRLRWLFQALLTGNATPQKVR